MICPLLHLFRFIMRIDIFIVKTMKSIAKILIVLGTILIFSGLFILGNKTPIHNLPNPSLVDTTKYTDVVLINRSNYDSVQVFITLQNTESVVGLFGMDSSNIVTYCSPNSIPCVGSFWAKKDVKYHLGVTKPMTGVIVTWGIQNQSCPAAQSILDSNNKKAYPYGINNFEFTVNTWWQNDSVMGKGESFDITCVDGLHSVLKQSVTSFGSRNENGLNPNFGAFWDFGYKLNNNLQPFSSSMNGVTLDGCVNIPGVFPYGCDWGYKSYQPPTPCDSPKYSVKCSTKWGDINTSQTNRQGQGGQVICEFIGFTKDAQPALK